MGATDAMPVPKINTAYRHYFAIRKNDGTLITTWAGQDSEVDLDAAGFTDCTNEATESGTSGCGYIDLTAAEMNASAVMLKVTVTNTDALPYVVVLFPEEAGDIRVAATMWNGVALATTNPLPNAAADAAGGLVISDAGGFNPDTITPALGTISAIALDVVNIDGIVPLSAAAFRTAFGTAFGMESDNSLAELATTPAAAPATPGAALMWLYMGARNGGTQNGSVRTVRTGAGTPISQATVSDSGTLFTLGVFADP